MSKSTLSPPHRAASHADDDDIPPSRVKKIILEKGRVFRADEPHIFWDLIDVMNDASCEFTDNRNELLQAFLDRRLYLMRIAEDKALYEQRELRLSLAEKFSTSPSHIVLPAFCVVDSFLERDLTWGCKMLWVREDIRRMGVATTFVTTLRVRTPTTPTERLEGGEPFWKTLDAVLPHRSCFVALPPEMGEWQKNANKNESSDGRNIESTV